MSKKNCLFIKNKIVILVKGLFWLSLKVSINILNWINHNLDNIIFSQQNGKSIHNLDPTASFLVFPQQTVKVESGSVFPWVQGGLSVKLMMSQWKCVMSVCPFWELYPQRFNLHEKGRDRNLKTQGTVLRVEKGLKIGKYSFILKKTFWQFFFPFNFWHFPTFLYCQSMSEIVVATMAMGQSPRPH